MTEEIKQILLKYITGKLPKEQGAEREIFNKISEKSRENWSSFVPTEYSNFRFEGLINIKNSSNLILYGGYKTKQEETKGIMIILNSNFEPLKTIYQYESGTDLKYIHCLSQAEDETFYLIDSPDYPKDRNWLLTTSQKRFVMLSNFVLSSKNPTIRISYNFPTSYNNFYCMKMKKDVNSSKYVLIGRKLRDETSPDFDSIRVIELEINVGEQNAWKKYDLDRYLLGDAYIDFDNDGNSCISAIVSNVMSDSKSVSTWIKKYSDTSFSLIEILKKDYHPFIDSVQYENQSAFINKNEVYFVLNNQHWGVLDRAEPKYIELYYYNLLTKEAKQIYSKYLGDYDYTNQEAIYITSNQNDIYIQYNNNIDNTNYIADYYFQRLINKEWNPILVGEKKNYIYNQRALYVNNDYNLLKYYAYAINPRSQTWETYEIKEIYNPDGYNGENYININSMVPDSVLLYDTNNDLIFVRSLYNKIINQNTTQATVEIPNLRLNEMNIEKQSLLGKTSVELVNSSQNIVKNIYETVLLNFFNTLLIKNNNGEELINQVASSKLNKDISEICNFDGTKATKIKINYTDGTYLINELSDNQITIESKEATYIFLIYCPNDKNITNIQIISNNEEIVYQEIIGNFENGKFYTITQKLKVL